MADIRSIDAFGDNPMVTWDDGDRIPLIRSGSMWVPQRAHSPESTNPPAPDPNSGGGSVGVTITSAMIKAGCDAGDDGGYPNPTFHDQGGYQGVADIFNDAIKKTHPVATKKQAACLVGESCQETGGYWYWVEAGGPFRYDPYRGRGYIQLTWSDNYASFGKWCQKYGFVSDASTFVNNPDSVATKKFVALQAIWEFDQTYSGKSLWQIADSSSSPWSRVSRAINTGNPDASFQAYAESLRARIIDAILAVTPDPAPVNGGGSVTPVDDYPYKTAAIGAVDPWNFYYRECVSFVCWRIRQRSKYSDFTNGWRTHWGNAYEWAGAADDAGIPRSGTPAVGDAAVRTSNPPGHVAWVYKVGSGGDFWVEEYNHDWSNGYGHVYDTRKCNVSTSGSDSFQTFIHFGLKG